MHDRRGEEVRLYPAAKDALRDLHLSDEWTGVEIAVASRTDYPEWADECMHLLEVSPGVSMHKAIAHKEIYPGSKIAHFKSLQEKTGIDFVDMIFFDNEKRNCEDVSRLGVTCVYTPGGMTTAFWEQGLKQFHVKRRSKIDAFISTAKSK